MAKNLDDLRDELYEAFNRATSKVDFPSSVHNYPEVAKAAAMALQAAAETARSIVAVEHEIADRDERKNGPRLPGKA